MLAGLVAVLITMFISLWWSLRHTYSDYKKGVDDMSTTQFYIFLVMNFFMVGLFVILILIFLGQIIEEFTNTRDFVHNHETIYTLAMIIVPSIYSYFTVRRYYKIKNNNSDTITNSEEINLDDDLEETDDNQ